MYKGFKLSLQFDTKGTEECRLLEEGKERNNSIKVNIHKNLSQYIRPDGSIDGALLSEDWFPEIQTHVFLSHSHEDEDNAIILSQLLYEHCKIMTFIDSCVWGYCDDLIKILDDKYCLSSDKNHYRYKDRNKTTSFVHSLLSSALTKMIDRSECLFFLNTPNSIIPDPKRSETSSPWIYYELLQTQMIRRKKREQDQRMFSSGGVLNEGAFRPILPADTSHLTTLSNELLEKWIMAGSYSYAEQALDKLYLMIQKSNGKQRLFT